jgi:hypothetical protein
MTRNEKRKQARELKRTKERMFYKFQLLNGEQFEAAPKGIQEMIMKIIADAPIEAIEYNKLKEAYPEYFEVETVLYKIKRKRGISLKR